MDRSRCSVMKVLGIRVWSIHFTFVEHDGKLFLGSWNSTAGLFDMFDHTDYAFWNHRALYMFGMPIPLSPFGQTAVTENNPAYFLYQSVIDDAASQRLHTG